jgi:hypothetical protein
MAVLRKNGEARLDPGNVLALFIDGFNEDRPSRAKTKERNDGLAKRNTGGLCGR